QVLRMQPGGALTLFNSQGGEFEAVVASMGRSEVRVRVGMHRALEREAAREVHLAAAMPANDRMDWLVEKAAELGAAGIQPLQSERSVLRLAGDRVEKKRAHWQAVAVAACEQCGRNRVPPVGMPQALEAWLASPAARENARYVLSLRADARPLREAAPEGAALFLSGPEGGLSEREEDLAREAGFLPVSLGPRTLRAETAPLAALAALTLG
ncbi:MAG: 16S rRNA (uracil(1498)-N(3))-methyltransferase, partial [Burkholderiaceae bacterium]